jgi:hypothetical protein
MAHQYVYREFKESFDEPHELYVVGIRQNGRHLPDSKLLDMTATTWKTPRRFRLIIHHIISILESIIKQKVHSIRGSVIRSGVTGRLQTSHDNFSHVDLLVFADTA